MLMRPQAGICPCCGQRLLLRHGVALSPMLADLFDMVERSGKRGIETDLLADLFYPGKPLQAARRAIKSNIFHLNAKLASTDLELRSGQGRHEPYRVQRRKSP